MEGLEIGFAAALSGRDAQLPQPLRAAAGATLSVLPGRRHLRSADRGRHRGGRRSARRRASSWRRCSSCWASPSCSSPWVPRPRRSGACSPTHMILLSRIAGVVILVFGPALPGRVPHRPPDERGALPGAAARGRRRSAPSSSGSPSPSAGRPASGRRWPPSCSWRRRGRRAARGRPAVRLLAGDRHPVRSGRLRGPALLGLPQAASGGISAGPRRSWAGCWWSRACCS